MIKENPVGREHASVLVKTCGGIHHKKEEHARFVRKEHKGNALEGGKFGPAEAFHKQLADLSDFPYQTGNLSKCVNPGVVRKTLFDHHLCQPTGRVIFLETRLVAYVLCRTDHTRSSILGYMHSITC